MKKAEVTAFLSLIFILMIAFIGGIMESASIQIAKNYRRADVNRAVESVFAEYQKELLEDYDIFALEGSYESGVYSEELLHNRLGYFGAGNMKHEIQKIQFLTDHNGQAFLEQVTYYMEQKYGLDLLKDKVSAADTWRAQEEKIVDYGKEEEKSKEKLAGVLQETEGELPEKDNPIAHISRLKEGALLDLVVPRDMDVSEKRIELSDRLSGREKNQGYGDFSEEMPNQGTLSSLLFGEYLLEHFTAASDEKKTGALAYELEYIYGGKKSDRENLEEVAKKLVLLRFVSNYTYLQSSSSKKAQAEALAVTLCTAAMAPAAEGAAMQMILLAWAFGESIVDMRALLHNCQVPMVKSDESWQLSLSALMKLGEAGDVNDGKNTEGGLSYREYLRILLFLQRKESVAVRALDIIEVNLRKVHNLQFFRTDYCISRFKIKSEVSLRRGITYRFQTYYGYH